MSATKAKPRRSARPKANGGSASMRFTYGTLRRMESAFGSIDDAVAYLQDPNVGPIARCIRVVWAARLADEPELKHEDVEREMDEMMLADAMQLAQTAQQAMKDAGLAEDVEPEAHDS